MTISEAKGIVNNYYENANPSEEDRFLYSEALRFLIAETKDANYMVDLGAMYYEQRNFKLALKYYELAAESDNVYALSDLGYIWYYGRTGETNYQKAFYYYDRARRMGDLVAAYKVADMYRHGYYVEKDPAKYRSIIEELYLQVRKARRLNDPLPEVYTRLAQIRAEEGDTREALQLYDIARDFLSQRIKAHPFFGDLNIMKQMITDVYNLRPFRADAFGLYDLYYLLHEPVKVRFYFGDRAHEVEAAAEGELVFIRFDGRWFRTADDFFMKAELDGRYLTNCYEEMYDFEVL